MKPYVHRRLRVFELMAKGKTNDEISQILDISRNKVAQDVHNILAAFSVRKRFRVVEEATSHGFVIFRGSEVEMHMAELERTLSAICPIQKDQQRDHENSAAKSAPKPFTQTILQGGNMPSLLSSREQDVLRWIAEGKTNAEIGSILQISKETVRNHVGHILGKLSTPNRICAVIEAVRRGFLVLDRSKEQHKETVLIAPEPKPGSRPLLILEGITVYDNFEVEIGVTNPRRDVIRTRSYNLLRFLANPVGRLHVRQAILDAVWGPSVFIEERAVDALVTRLRKFLNGCPYAIKTERGIGYSLVHV
ncbi:MAG: hypothetical protein UY97_C0005G0021 [Parcubacteria group bacterium GW2011_GWB1_57_6]|nr:MAG: hypothetical protein UY93_C0002G0274 [Parcubacteria group bacterium GW2011_GWA1_56_13]KKW46476.1 MAG: hypothetical protein UY97_C0005G0021 [Parcubacteria group bacterium GW2011_GWB1_57_6]